MESGLMAIMHAAGTGDADARDRLFAMLYEELHRMAQRELRRGAAVTLSPTTLLHETFLNISHRESLAFGDCGQFSVRRRQFPFKHPHVGAWLVQFDQQATYDPNASAYTRLKIVVSRKPGSRS